MTCFTYPEFIFLVLLRPLRAVVSREGGWGLEKEQFSCRVSTFDAFSLSSAILLSLIDIRIHFGRAIENT